MERPQWTSTSKQEVKTLSSGLPNPSPDMDNEGNSLLSSNNDQPPERLATPTSFPAFPYPTPYAIQTQFMQQLFECVDQRRVGIFESPTGTGKSLSMICGAVSWLMEYNRVEQERALEDQSVIELSVSSTKKSSGDTPDWVQQHRTISDATIERQERDRKRQELEDRVQRIRDREKKIRESMVRKLKRQAAGAHSIGGYRPQAGQPAKKKVAIII
jgi:chromosome transmission fidelity protein 1